MVHPVSDYPGKLIADAYRHAAVIVRDSLDEAGPDAVAATLERMALYAEAGTVPGQPLPEAVTGDVPG